MSEEKKSEDTESIIGKVASGDVTNVTSFGAFVRLENGEEGLVHISEIANEYVTDIHNFISIGDKVTVKVLTRNSKNKLDLSIKQTKEKEAEPVLFLHRKSKNTNFEDKLGQFLKRSEEKQIDIRRNLKQKQGITKKRK
jgi:S1 RNA binding domain protein